MTDPDRTPTTQHSGHTFSPDTYALADKLSKMLDEVEVMLDSGDLYKHDVSNMLDNVWKLRSQKVGSDRFDAFVLIPLGPAEARYHYCRARNFLNFSNLEDAAFHATLAANQEPDNPRYVRLFEMTKKRIQSEAPELASIVQNRLDDRVDRSYLDEAQRSDNTADQPTWSNIASVVKEASVLLDEIEALLAFNSVVNREMASNRLGQVRKLIQPLQKQIDAQEPALAARYLRCVAKWSIGGDDLDTARRAMDQAIKRDQSPETVQLQTQVTLAPARRSKEAVDHLRAAHNYLIHIADDIPDLPGVAKVQFLHTLKGVTKHIEEARTLDPNAVYIYVDEDEKERISQSVDDMAGRALYWEGFACSEFRAHLRLGEKKAGDICLREAVKINPDDFDSQKLLDGMSYVRPVERRPSVVERAGEAVADTSFSHPTLACFAVAAGCFVLSFLVNGVSTGFSALLFGVTILFVVIGIAIWWNDR